jgi:uncharacterized protein YbcI
MVEPASDRAESVQATISTEMVRLYKELFGRGPTKAKTDILDNVVLCTLEDSLTMAERNLSKLGEHARLRDIRLFFQHASETEFRAIIEEITGRKVRAFISGMDTSQDVAAELFYLEPEDAAQARPSPPSIDG